MAKDPFDEVVPDDENEETPKEASEETPKETPAEEGTPDYSALGVTVTPEMLENESVRKALDAALSKHQEVVEQGRELAKRGYNHELVTRVINNPQFDQFLELHESGKLGEVLASSSSESNDDEGMEAVDPDVAKLIKQLGERVEVATTAATRAEQRAVNAELSQFKSTHSDWKAVKDDMVAVLRKNPDLSYEEAYREVKGKSALSENERLRREVHDLRSKLAKTSAVENGAGAPSDEGVTERPRVQGRSYAEIARASLRRQGG